MQSISKLALIAFCFSFSLNLQAQNYCSARSGFPWEEWIEDVRIDNLVNNDNGKARDFNTAGYSDFTDLSPSIIVKGSSVEFAFSSGRSGTSAAGFWTVYIDFNQDGDFTDAGENVLREEANGQDIAGRFDIPVTAQSGTTRLRILLAKGGFAQACDEPARGEVEDYSLNIGNATQNLPDLLSSNFSPPPNGPTNSIVNFTVDIKNEGTGPANSDFELGLFLSADPSLSPDDIEVGEITTGNFAALSFIQNIPGSFDLSGVAPRTYFLLLVMDRDDDILESNESNNLVSTLFTVDPAQVGIGADLELSITADKPTPIIFETVRLRVEVENEGPNRLQEAEIRLPSSPDYVIAGNGTPTLSNGNLSIESTAIKWSLNSLEVGEAASLEIDIFTLAANTDPCVQVYSARPGDPDSTPNNFDCTSIPQEDDEGSLRQGVGSGNSTVDLVATQLSTPPSEMTNSQVNFGLDIRNDGNSNSPLFNVILYLSDDDLFSTDDIGLFQTTPLSLAAGETLNLLPSQSFFSTRGIAPGNYFLIAKVDSGDNIDESDEGNNFAVQAFQVSPEEPNRIDYVLSDLQAPDSGLSSETIDLSVDLASLGNSTLFRQTTIEIFLSTDNTLNSEDQVLSSFQFSTSRPDAIQDDRGASFSLKGIIPGDYFLILKIDPGEQFMEPNESNNLLSQAFTVLAEPLPDCATVLGGDRILCSETIGDITRLFIQDGPEIFQYDLAQEGSIQGIVSMGRLSYDSTLIRNGELIYQDANGQVLFQQAIPQNVLDILPTINTATRLSDGNFLLGGRYQSSSSPPFTSELRLVKTDGNLNVLNSTVLFNNTQFPANSNDRIDYLTALDDGEAGIIYTIYSNRLIATPSLTFGTVSEDLTATITNGFFSRSLRSIAETPCGDLLAEINVVQFSQKSSTRGNQILRLSKEGSQSFSNYEFLRRAVDRLPTVLDRAFSSDFPEPFLAGYTITLPFSLQDSIPPTVDVQLYGTGPDTTFLELPYVDFEYATRNGQTALLYGIVNGELTAVGSNCGNSAGVDLEVTLSVDNDRPAVFQNILYTLTVRNIGTEDASGLVIDFDHGAQEAPKRLAFVNQSDPTYNSWEGIWQIGDLAAGGARTMNLELFVLSAAAPETSLTAFVDGIDQIDGNPGNDRSTATIDLSNNLTSRMNSAKGRQVSSEMNKLIQVFPSPVRKYLTVSLQNSDFEAYSLEIYDATGSRIQSIPITNEAGFQQLQINVSSLAEGMYYLLMPEASGKQRSKRFIKIE